MYLHIQTINKFKLLSLLSKKGIIIIEIQYLLNTLKDLTFDNIYHEHYNYWSLTSLINFLTLLNIIRVEKINTHGGSLRIYVKKGQKIKIEKNVKDILKEEENFGLKKVETYKKFGEKVYQISQKL